MRRTLYIILLAAAGILCACQRESTESLRGKGDIVIELGPALQTKADEARDGSKMNNLHIWLVKGNSIVDYLNGKVAYTDENTSYCEINAGGATAKAVFAGVNKGEYTLYFVANLPSGFPLDTYVIGKSIDDNFKDKLLADVVNNEPPYNETSGMPLSLVKSISVGAGTNRIYAELVRTCARIRLTVRNNTVGNSLILKKVALSADGNPSTGYLFPRADFSRPGATMGPFKSLELTTQGETTDIVIPHGETHTYIDQYMYETGPNGAVSLGFEIAGGLFKGDVTSDEIQMGLVNINKKIVGSPLISQSKSTTAQYLIKSYAGDYFLYDNGGTPKATTSISSDELATKSDLGNYLWTFSAATGTTNIKNVGTGNYLIIGTDGSVKMSSTSTTAESDYTDGKGFRFYNSTTTQSGWTRTCTAYTLSVGSSDVSLDKTETTGWWPSPLPSSNDNNYFLLYPVTDGISSELFPKYKDGSEAEKYFDQTITGLNYIGKYGAPVPLEHIYRNQDVQIVVNVHYNPASGVLYFETSDWVPVDNETTFD